VHKGRWESRHLARFLGNLEGMEIHRGAG